MIISRLLSRWADAELRQLVLRLQAQLAASARELAVTEAERDALAAVVARDRERIKAEGAAYARQRAEAEGIPHERDTESFGRRIA